MPDKESKKKEMPKIYQDEKSIINMHSSMITNKTSFKALWKRNRKRIDLDAAWQRVEAWKKSFN